MNLYFQYDVLIVLIWPKPHNTQKKEKHELHNTSKQDKQENSIAHRNNWKTHSGHIAHGNRLNM